MPGSLQSFLLRAKKVRTWILWGVIPLSLAGYYVSQLWLEQQRFARWRQELHVRQGLLGIASNLGSAPAGATLEDELERIGRALPYPLVLDEQLAGEPKHQLQSGREPVLFGEEFATLQSVLSRRARMAAATISGERICYRVDVTQVVLQSTDDQGWPHTTRFYPLPASGPAEHVWTTSEIAFLVREYVGRHNPVTDWLQQAPGGLFVTATDEVHEQIGWYLASLNSFPSMPDSLEPRPLLAPPTGDSGNRVLAALDSPLDLGEFSGTVGEALGEIAQRKQIAIRVEQDANWKLEENFDYLRQNPQTLRELLRQAWVSYRVDSQMLTVMNLTDAEQMPTFIAYPVHDLTGPNTRISAAELVASIEHRPDYFERHRSRPAIWVMDEWLLLHGDEAAHAEVKSFLSALRGAQAESRGKPSGNEGVGSLANRVERRLTQPSFHFVPMKLREFCSLLEKELGCQVVCSFAHADLNIMPVTRDAELGQALDDSLSILKVSYQHLGKQLRIIEDREHFTNTSVYDVGILTEPRTGLLSPSMLVRFLKQELARNGQHAGGEDGFDFLGSLLLVDQSTPAQWRVRSLLGYLREHQWELPRLADVAEHSGQHPELMGQLHSRLENSTDWRERAYLQFVLDGKGIADATHLAE